MKKIICTTDYSEHSVAALKYGVTMGKQFNADVILLHVYAHSEGHNKKDTWKNHQEKLEDFCKMHVPEDCADVTVAAVKGNDVPKAILEFARDINVLSIVMGACCTSTIREAITGSTTKEMTEISPFPVLAISANQKPGTVQKILFASTLAGEDLEYILELTVLFAPLQPTIQVVHVTHKEKEEAEKALQEFREEVQKKVSYPNLEFEILYSSEVFEAIQERIDSGQPDILAIPEHRQKDGFNKIIIRDKIKRIQSFTGVPVLTLPAEK